jgi:predicted deacylase
MIEARVFCSTLPGPHLLLLGGVHGDEPCGTVALARLADELASGQLELLGGRVTLVPKANPQAGTANVRYKDENLNRIMRPHDNPHTYERRVANTICQHIHGVDAVLDLHAVTAKSPPFSFLDWDTPATRAWLEKLGVPFMLKGWDTLYPEDKDSSTTVGYATSLGKPAVVVECGQKTDPATADIAYRMARITLAHHGLTAPYPLDAQPSKVLRMTQVVWKEAEGDLTAPFDNFSTVKAGQVLARYQDGHELKAQTDGHIIMPKATAVIGEEWYYLSVAA